MPARRPVPARVIPLRVRWERERKRQRAILVGGLLSILIVLGVIGTGYFFYRIYPRWEPVLRVNGTTFSGDYLVSRLRPLRALLPPTADPAQLVESILNEVKDEEIIRQGAAQLGVVVTHDEVTETLRKTFLPEGGNEAQFQQKYVSFLRQQKLADRDYRQAVEANLLRQHTLDYFSTQIPTAEEQVHLFAISVGTEAQAQELRQRLEEGELFSDLAREFSRDDTSKEQGGDLGWRPRGIQPELDSAAFMLNPGEISQPIAAQGSYYLLEVTERGDQPLKDEHRQQLAQQTFADWLTKQREASQVTVSLDERRRSWVLAQLGQR